MLASNPVARELFTDWQALSADGRNLVLWVFTSGRAREVYLDWETEARAMLGRFRLAAAGHPHDPDFMSLISELRRDSQHVRDWWPRHDVTAMGSRTKKLLHPRFGPVEYSHVVLQIADHPDQTLVTYSPAGTEDHRKRIRRPLPDNGLREGHGRGPESFANDDFAFLFSWLVNRAERESRQGRTHALRAPQSGS